MKIFLSKVPLMNKVIDIFGPGRRVPKATLVVLVVVVICSPSSKNP